MLTSLSIKNYALIEDIQMNLQKGFTIITGETGAGKSIMLGALSLLLGKRADLGAIRDAGKKCVIEGCFDVSAYELGGLFEDNDLDYEAQTIIRREILPSGKSRAFVNDTPATVASLQALGNRLIDIHSQHENLVLGEADYQFMVIDVLAGNQQLLQQYKEALWSYRQQQRKLEKLRGEQLQASREYDYNLFLLNELKEANLQPGMQEELESRLEELSHVEQLQEHLGAALQQVQQEEIGVAAGLKEAKAQLQRIAGIALTYEELHNRVESVVIEVDDIMAELENSLEKVEANPEELEAVNDRLQILYNLQKKHQAADVSELENIREELQQKVFMSEDGEHQIAEVEEKIKQHQKKLDALAQELNQRRKKAVPEFIKQLEGLLSQVGMPNARLKVEVLSQQEYYTNGKDKMQWLLSANKGGHFNELKKAASGGELSRIMLGVKSILASKSNLPTIIFDEIDTGVSGDIAQKMAEILQKMGSDMQVIAITHLPQIAGKGQTHFKIYKEDSGQTTTTRLVELGPEDRVQELAMMLGGKDISESAVAHAKSLLN